MGILVHSDVIPKRNKLHALVLDHVIVRPPTLRLPHRLAWRKTTTINC